MQIASTAADHIAVRAHAVAVRVVDAQYARDKSESVREQCIADTENHLRSLSEAIRGGSEQLFVDYIEWARTFLSSRHVSHQLLTEQLALLQRFLRDDLPEDISTIDTFMRAALDRLAAPEAELATEIEPETLAERYLERLLAYDRNGALSLIHGAFVSGTSIRELYIDIVQRVQREIGRLWQLNQLSVAQEHYCTAVSQLALAQLYPYLMHAPGLGPRMVTACVAGELHEMGARMVADFFEMDGWDTTYVGANTPDGDLVQVLRARCAPLLAISATLNLHISAVRELIHTVRSAPDLDHVKILVGGRPFCVAGRLWQRLGADGCANDADEAVRMGRRLLVGAPS